MKRNHTIDILKFLAIIAVVYTHSKGVHQSFFGANFGAFLIDCAVPMFIILTGYNYAASAKNRQLDTLRAYYSPKNLSDKLLRLLPAYVAAVVLQLCIFRFDNIVKYIIGAGPGGYYTFMLLQIILLFPFVYFAANKKPVLSLLLFLALQIAFEISMVALKNTSFYTQFYRYFFARHLFAIVLGVFLYLQKYKVRLWVLAVCGAAGAAYLSAIVFWGFDPIIISSWKQTSFVAALWAFAIVGICLKYVRFSAKKCAAVIEICGGATYHIFLVQSTFFLFANWHWSLNILITVPIGIVLFLLEKHIRKLLKLRHVTAT